MSLRWKSKFKSHSPTYEEIDVLIDKLDEGSKTASKSSQDKRNISLDIDTINNMFANLNIANEHSPEIDFNPSSDRRYKIHKWKLDVDTISKWKPLDEDFQCPMKTDCVINTMAVLGAIKKRNHAEALARVQNELQNGIHNDIVLDMIYYYQLAENTRANKQSYTHRIQLYNPHYDEQSFDWLKDELNEGDAVFITVFTKYSGHAIIIYKYNGNLHLFDPQTNMLFQETNIREYIEMSEIYEYTVMMEFEKPVRKLEETMLQVRKRKHYSPAAKKTRKNTPRTKTPTHIPVHLPKSAKKNILRAKRTRRT